MNRRVETGVSEPLSAFPSRCPHYRCAKRIYRIGAWSGRIRPATLGGAGGIPPIKVFERGRLADGLPRWSPGAGKERLRRCSDGLIGINIHANQHGLREDEDRDLADGKETMNDDL